MNRTDKQNPATAATLLSWGSAANLLSLILAACVLASSASANEEQRGAFPAEVPKSYRVECGTCHVPFAPDLLPADTWRQIMVGLGRHYGVDAAIDTREHAEIEEFLVRYAGHGLGTKRNGDHLRLTDTLWFHRRHGRVKTLFKYPLVGSKANCSACHVHAEDGRYEEYTPLIFKYMGRSR